MKSNTKNEYIKIRVTKQEKEHLKKQADTQGKTLSAYMLEQGMRTNSICKAPSPDTIDNYDLLNEIYHQIRKSNDDHLKNRIESIIERNIQNEH